MTCHEKLHVHTYSDKCGITAFFSRKSRVFETAPFVVIVNSKNWLQKNHKFQYLFLSRSVLFISCLKNAKNISSQKESGFFPSDFEFSFSAKFRDLLTSNDVISVLICISSVEVYREFQCKILRYDLLFRALRVVKKMTVSLSLPVNYRPVSSAIDVPYDVISGVIAGLQNVYPHFSVMPDGLVYESEEKFRAHFFANGDPFSDWTTTSTEA